MGELVEWVRGCVDRLDELIGCVDRVGRQCSSNDPIRTQLIG